jgi:hypothetical protein
MRVAGKRSDPPCSTWVECYMAMADTFTDMKRSREIVDEQSTSDHASFWRYGYAAIRGGHLDKDPVNHTIGDTVGPYRYYDCGTNKIPLYTEVIKAAVATVAKLAGARAEPPGVAESPPSPGGRLLGPTRAGRVGPGGTGVQDTPALGVGRLPSVADFLVFPTLDGRVTCAPQRRYPPEPTLSHESTKDTKRIGTVRIWSVSSGL